MSQRLIGFIIGFVVATILAGTVTATTSQIVMGISVGNKTIPVVGAAGGYVTVAVN